MLVVWRLDRLGRSLGHLIELLHGLAARGVQFRSLSEHIDTTTPTGKLTFHVIGALAEFERAIIVERTGAGLKAAKARGVQLGRKPSMTPAQAKRARTDQACPGGSRGRRESRAPWRAPLASIAATHVPASGAGSRTDDSCNEVFGAAAAGGVGGSPLRCAVVRAERPTHRRNNLHAPLLPGVVAQAAA